MGRPKQDEETHTNLTIRLSKEKRDKLEALRKKLDMASLTELLLRSTSAVEELAKYINECGQVKILAADGSTVTVILR